MLRFKSFINLLEDTLDQQYSNAQPASGPQPRNLSPNPLGEKKKVKGFKESLQSGENGYETGVSGTLSGAAKVEPMVTPGQVKRKKVNMPDSITLECVCELEKGLQKLNDCGHEPINQLMMNISKKHGITGKELHNMFKEKNKTTPDNWIKNKLGAK
jgi:hypothetical protein